MMRYCVLLLGLMLVGGTCLGQDMAELEVDHNVRAEFATPHTDWGVPYALGKTRVLFFLRGHDTEPREVIELKQRFDFEPQMVFWTRIIDSQAHPSLANWPLPQKRAEIQRALASLPGDKEAAAKYERWGRELAAQLKLMYSGSAGAIMAEANAARTIGEWERELPALELKALLNEI